MQRRVRRPGDRPGFAVPTGAAAILAGLLCLASGADRAAASRGTLVGWGALAVNGESNRTFAAIEAGDGHILALRGDGSIAAWGGNAAGQCIVPLPNSGFVAVSGGAGHSLGLKGDGSIVAWGDNARGQCDVPVPNADFVAVSAGEAHSLGLKSDGSIVAWGDNYWGQCDVPVPNTGFRAVTAGNHVSGGLRADSTLVVWGRNAYGQGDIPPPNAGFVAVQLYSGACLGLKADGSIVAWGDNSQGQCNVPAPNAGFVAAAAGGNDFSLGLRADGSIVGWGKSAGGVFDIPAPNTDFVAVTAGVIFGAGLKASGEVVAWGSNGAWLQQIPGADDLVSAAMSSVFYLDRFGIGLRSDGSLLAWGNNTHGQLVLPARNADFLTVSTGLFHALALRADGTIAAWGDNSFGQCVVPDPNGGFAGVAAGNNHSLGLRADGTVAAWGINTNGQCDVPAPNGSFVAVAAGGNHSLGLTRDGAIVGWGHNASGQCDVPAPNAGFVAVTARLNHSLGLKADGRVVAWGNNDNGQCNVPQPNAGFTAIAAGGAHNMALRADGSVAVWGSSLYSQDDIPAPNARFVAIAAGGDICLALRQVDTPPVPDHPILTEIVVDSGSDGNWQLGSDSFALFNPTVSAMDLGQVYVTDAGNRAAGLHYYDIVRRGRAGGGGTDGDFHARFPAGAVLAPGDTIVVALAGSSQYVAAYGRLPDYELFEDYRAPDQVPELVEVFPGSVGCGLGSDGANVPDLDAAGETLVLYRWDGAGDLVQDLDYVTWGADGGSRIDKTGVAVDGPDADGVASAYRDEAAVSAQQPVALLPHARCGSYRRRAGDEDGELLAGGNGATGHVESREPLAFTWTAQNPPTPAATPASWLRTTPIIMAPALTPAVPVAGETVTVDATIESRESQMLVRLQWSVNGGPFTAVTCANVGGASWRGQIPAQPTGAAVAWYVEAITFVGARATRPAEAPIYTNSYTVADLPPAPPSFDAVSFTPTVPYGDVATALSLRFSPAGGAPNTVQLFCRITGETTELVAAPDGEAWVATIPAQAAGTWVDWYVVAQNSGGSTWYPDGAPAVQNSFRVRDVAPPTGTLLAASGTAGSALAISAWLTDELGVANAWLFYRAGGTAAFDSVEMTAGAPFHTGMVASAQVGAAGLQYCVRAQDLDGNRAWFPAGAPQQLASVAIAVPALPAFTLAANQYWLGGIPLIAGAGAPDSVFSALGSYDPTRWRYLTPPYEAGGYREYPAAAPARAGQGFWIVAREATQVQVSGWVARLDRDCVIPLQPGWNMVAAPFAFPVDTLGIGYPPGAAHDFVAHSPAGYAHEAGALEPGRGYFLWHDGEAGAQLRLPPRRAADAAARSGAVAPTVPTRDETGWSVEASALCDELADTGNRCGQRPGATAGLDGCDLRDAPPPPGDHVSLCFVDEDGVQLYRDYRDPAAAGQVWTLRLTGNRAGRPVVVRFAPQRPLPPSWRLLALDLGDLRETALWPPPADGSAVELRDRVSSGAYQKTWRLIAGPPEYVESASQAARAEVNAAIAAFSLGPVSPNPCRAPEGTVVSLAVPRSGPVKLQVYDLRGRLVRTLQTGPLAQGLHRLAWDGTDDAGRRIPAGVYFARLQAAGVRLVQKVTVVR